MASNCNLRSKQSLTCCPVCHMSDVPTLTWYRFKIKAVQKHLVQNERSVSAPMHHENDCVNKYPPKQNLSLLLLTVVPTSLKFKNFSKKQSFQQLTHVNCNCKAACHECNPTTHCNLTDLLTRSCHCLRIEFFLSWAEQ